MRADEESDAELLARVPDREAVGAFYARHVDSVLRFAIRRCREPQDAADLVSLVFTEVFAAASGFDGRRDARPWLLGIAARCLADQQRQGFRQAEIAQRLGGRLSLDDDEYARVEEMIDAARWTPVVERALRERLSDAERSVFLLVAADELTPAQAAKSLGIGAVVARMRLSRARKKLRSAVEHGAPDLIPHPAHSSQP